MSRSATSRSESSESDDSDSTAREDDEAKASKVSSRLSTHSQLNDYKRASSNGTLNMKNMIQELVERETVAAKSIEGSKTSVRSREETKPKQADSLNSSRLSNRSNAVATGQNHAQTNIPVVNKK